VQAAHDTAVAVAEQAAIEKVQPHYLLEHNQFQLVVVAADSILVILVLRAEVLYLVLFQLQAVAEVLGIMIVIQNQAVRVVVVVAHKLMHTEVVAAAVQAAAEVIAVQQLTQEMNQQYKEFLVKEIPVVTVTTTVADLEVQAAQELLPQLVVVQLREQVAVVAHRGLVVLLRAVQAVVAQQALVAAVATVIRQLVQIQVQVAAVVMEVRHEAATAHLVL
jgi:hypothetical protein